MGERVIEGILLDVEYANAGGKSIIRLFVRAENGIGIFEDHSFKPYFFVVVSDLQKAKKELAGAVFGEGAKIAKIEPVKKTDYENVLKLSFENVQELVAARSGIEGMPGILSKAEQDIPFAKRYLLDHELQPMNGIRIEAEGNAVGKATAFEIEQPVFRIAAFDLETHSPGRFSNPKKDPILMASFALPGKTFVLTHGKKNCFENTIVFEKEREMVLALEEKIKKESLDIIATYNGDLFDFPYVKERASLLGLQFAISTDGSAPKIIKKGRDSAAKLAGLQHLDVYQMLRFLSRFAVVNLIKFDLESVVASLYGEEKEKIHADEINLIWETGKGLERLAEYCAADSAYTLRIAEQYLPLLVELCKIVKQPLFEVGRASASMLVEYLIMSKCREIGMLVANKPDDAAIQQRLLNPIKGGYVKEPLPGLHENLAMLDFSSLYPTIIISHNVSPDTIGCAHEECRQKNLAPNNQWFCSKKKGLIPEILKDLFEKRMQIKKQAKSLDKTDEKFALLNARQHALKILLNSFYGYLLYSRSRFYNREAGSAITAWARQYVQWVGKEAEKAGFGVVYGDSISRDRFVTILNQDGLIEVKNIEALFKEIKGLIGERNGKEFKTARGYSVLSVNQKTGKSEWAELKEIIRHKTKKKMLRVNQKFGETIATEDHSIIARTENGLKSVSPKEMHSNRFFPVKKIPKAGMLKQIDLFETLKNGHYDRALYKGQIKISQWHKSNSHVWFGFMDKKKQIKAKRFIETGSKEFEALCRLLGAYIAEGSSTTIETSLKKSGACIASSDRAWLKALQKDYHMLFENAKSSIIRSMKAKRSLCYGAGKKVEYFDKTLKLQMMNETAAEFFKGLCSQKSKNKKMPTFIFNVPNKYKRILLKKMVEGDGSHSVNKRLGYSKQYIKKNFRYTTISLAVASGLSLLLRQLGINYSMHYRPAKKAYEIQTSANSNSRIVTKIVEEKCNGFVYDLSVQKNNNFVDACGQVLLHNTDSELLAIPKNKTQEDVKEFVEGINKQLPGVMNLELEGFFKRGIFVTKDTGEGAKKKYALIDYKGNLKIVGFEYVRRDWAPIAKETQRNVLKAILEEGKPEKAVETVRLAIKKLKEGKAGNKELVVLTQIKRALNKYESIGPHVAAAKKAVARGKEIEIGSVIGYIITKSGKSISDRAQLQEFVKEGNYDAEYYIEHQVLPAVIKIMKELGYSREDLAQGGKQHKLSFFG